MNEQIKAQGKLHILLKSEDGTVLVDKTVPNLVVSVGRNFIASRIAGNATPVMSHMAVGTSATAPAIGNTTLGAEVGRVAITSGTASSSDVTYIATFGAGVGTGALVEAGLFNAASLGTMLCRTTFAVVNKGASDTLQITWTVSVT